MCVLQFPNESIKSWLLTVAHNLHVDYVKKNRKLDFREDSLLNQIKVHDFPDGLMLDVNIDDLIKHVENNGAEYVGMYISADSKELLKFKGNALIDCIRVQNIVLW